MYIVSMSGEVLAEFDKWDISSVAKAEKWILDHGCVIWKCELTVSGTYVITVKNFFHGYVKCHLSSVYGKMAREEEE